MEPGFPSENATSALKNSAAIKDALIRADVGTELAHELAAEVGQGRYDTDIAEHELRGILADAIAKVLTPVEKPLRIDSAHRPFVVLVAGVNGTAATNFG